MNPGQEMFYNFFMERVKEGKETEAETVLKEGFKRQEEGTFDKEYLEKMIPVYMELAKPEALGELQEAMSNFSSRLQYYHS